MTVKNRNALFMLPAAIYEAVRWQVFRASQNWLGTAGIDIRMSFPPAAGTDPSLAAINQFVYARASFAATRDGDSDRSNGYDTTLTLFENGIVPSPSMTPASQRFSMKLKA